MKITLKGVTFYRSQDAASLLERSVYTVQKWCRQGRLDGSRKIGRDLLIPERSVQKMKVVIRPRKMAEASFA